jgi:hypothetical protein
VSGVSLHAMYLYITPDSSNYLDTILIQFHPPANVTPDFHKREKKEIHVLHGVQPFINTHGTFCTKFLAKCTVAIVECLFLLKIICIFKNDRNSDESCF